MALKRLTKEESEGAIRKFVDILKFETVSGNGEKGPYNDCVKWILSELADIGFDCEILRESVPNKPILCGRYLGSDPNLPAILLNSHYDVVPVVESLWTVPCFEGLRQHGRVYGRGAQDMKSVCVQYLVALRKLIIDLCFKPIRTIVISYVPDEEIGGVDGMRILLQSSFFSQLHIGLALDEGLASEDNDYSVFYGERLPWWVTVKANGATGHASRFIDGTAVEQIIGVTQRALAFREDQKNILHGRGAHAGCSHAVVVKKKTLGDVTSLNVTVLRAGVTAGGVDVLNVIPPSAEAKFDIRIAPHTDPAEIAHTLDTWCQEVSSSTVGSSTTGVTWSFLGTPLQQHHTTSTDAGTNPWWELFNRTLQEGCGIKTNPSVFPAATDSRFLRALGVRAFGFSPMRRSPILLHENDEYLDEVVFIEGCEVYVHVLEALASQGRFAGDNESGGRWDMLTSHSDD